MTAPADARLPEEDVGSAACRESTDGRATKVLSGASPDVWFDHESGEASAIKILIVDDHALIREALRGVLEELDAGATIVEAEDAGQAARRIDEHPDLALIVLDLALPDRDGFELLPEWRARFPAVSIVVLSASEERADIVSSLELGVSGFIPKSVSRSVMLGAFELIFAGGVYIPPEALQQAFAGAVPDVPTRSIAGPDLTERQRDVLSLMMRGMSNKAICRELDIAEATVKNHVTAILRALGAGNRTEAVIAAGALAAQARRRR